MVPNDDLVAVQFVIVLTQEMTQFPQAFAQGALHLVHVLDNQDSNWSASACVSASPGTYVPQRGPVSCSPDGPAYSTLRVDFAADNSGINRTTIVPSAIPEK
jgi:hypothetical protein